MTILLLAASTHLKTSGSPVIAAIIFGLFAAFFLWLALAALIRRHRMVSTETSSISSAPSGFAELHGRIAAMEQLTSPFSKAACVYFSFKVQERRRRKNGHYWATIRHGSGSVDFALDDGTGRALIRPKGAEFLLKTDANARSGTFNDPTPDLAEFFASVNVSPTSFFGLNRGLRVEESFLAHGDELYLMGKTRPCGGAEAQQSGATVVMSAGGPDFLISDQGEAAVTSGLLRRAIACGVGALVFGGVACFIVGIAATHGR